MGGLTVAGGYLVRRRDGHWLVVDSSSRLVEPHHRPERNRLQNRTGLVGNLKALTIYVLIRNQLLCEHFPCRFFGVEYRVFKRGKFQPVWVDFAECAVLDVEIEAWHGMLTVHSM